MKMKRLLIITLILFIITVVDAPAAEEIQSIEIDIPAVLPVVESIIVPENPEITMIKEFLAEDRTNEHEYTNYYDCGDFAKTLSKNASIQNISIGCVLLSNNPNFRGNSNHIMNYFEIDGKYYFIEPQNDMIFPPEETIFNFAKFYPNGNVPSRWKNSLNYDLEIGI
jgi:hypothetical protein